MFKSKLAKSIIALIAVVIVAVAIPVALGGNNVQASGDYTFNGKTYKSEDAKNAAVRKWNDSRLSDTQKKLVQAANDEAAASTGFTSSIYHTR
ncbi:hypothetical protein ACUIJQ_11495 [Levilactobacillus hammesii]|uniref:hypothetical protein n=1 Tax=Levilactobacillus hammesii TaxID=267633 RepID=UPI000710E3FA|nr:hypothetical protein [Levilactobacillus hammesii]